MAMQAHYSSLPWTAHVLCPFLPSLPEPGSLLLDLPYRLPIPRKEAEAGVFRKEVSDVQVELVQAYVEEDAWLRMGGVDQEVTDCSQSSRWHVFPTS